VFNFSIGNEVLGLLCPPGALPAPSAPTHNNLSSPFLLTPSRSPGNDMPLSQFCTQYWLAPNILKILEENSYVHARTLRFVRIDELKEMCFCLGEIAAFRDAVEVWSELRVV
jgi:hypothetical protein